MRRTRKQSIFKQFVMMAVILMLVLIITFLITSQQMQMMQKKSILNYNDQYLAQIENLMEEYDRMMTQIATVTAYSPTIYTYFFQNAVERVISTDDVNTVFSNTILLENNIAGIYLFDKDMEQIASMGKGTQEVEGMEFIHVKKERQEYSSLFSFKNSNNPYYAFYFPVFNLNSQIYGQQIGMCVFIMKTDKLLDFLQEKQATEHTQLYLLDNDLEVLAVQGGDPQGNWEPDWMHSGSDYHVKCKNLSMGGWKIVSRIPVKELYTRNGLENGFHMGTNILAFGMLAGMMIFFYTRLIVPVREMDSFVNRLLTEPEARITIKRQDEIGAVEQRLNEMLDAMKENNIEIQNAREKVYQMESAEKQLQILAYRNQINPHFLYNTLDCIRGMALYHEEDAIAEITLALSKLFRFAVKGGNIVKVEEEVAHIREYSRIIDHRFQGRIRVLVEMDECVGEKPIIKFLLQPLIENAVFHGLEQKIDGGEVRAVIRMAGEDRMVFTVEDNGCGMTQTQLDTLKSMLEQGENQTGIGMANIYQRIKLFYGENALFSIESVWNQGTKVVIVVPAQIEEGTAVYV